MLHPGSEKNEQKTGSSIPLQTKAALLVTRIYLPRCRVVLLFFLANKYIKIETIQRRLPWTVRKDESQIHEAFQIINNLK